MNIFSRIARAIERDAQQAKEISAPDPNCRVFGSEEAWVMYRNREAYVHQSQQQRSFTYPPVRGMACSNPKELSC